MRSGQELRKKTRHKEFINEILTHAKDFSEYHKKRVAMKKKFATLVKNNIEQKERKE